MVKRWLLRICVFLIVGAIVNVGVAWGSCLWSRLHSVPTRKDATDEQLAWLLQSGWIRQETLYALPMSVRLEPHRGIGVEFAVAHSAPTSGVSLVQEAYGITCRAGFPVSGVTGALITHDAISYPLSFGRTLGAIDPVTQLPHIRKPITVSAVVPQQVSWLGIRTDGRFVPLRPIWPGFAINTLFYAFVLWLLFALGGTPFALRRRRRIKRGLCPRCAYDLRGSPHDAAACPECGATK